MCLVGIVMAYQLSWKASISACWSDYSSFQICSSFHFYIVKFDPLWCLILSEHIRAAYEGPIFSSYEQNAKTWWVFYLLIFPSKEISMSGNLY